MDSFNPAKTGLDGFPISSVGELQDDHEEQMQAGLPRMLAALNKPEFVAEREVIWKKVREGQPAEPRQPSEAEIVEFDKNNVPERFDGIEW